MKRMLVAKRIQGGPQRKVVSPSKSAEDMLNAFEAKLAEFGLDASTCAEKAPKFGREDDIEAIEGCGLNASDDFDEDEISRQQREVEIYGEDANEKYEDVGGGFGEDGEIFSLAEIKDYWNKNNVSDPVLADYPNFDRWWNDTRSNYMERYY